MKIYLNLYRKHVITLIFCVLAGQAISLPVSSTPLLEDIDRRLENLGLQKLAAVQADPDHKLAPFSSDGCSGGLSDGWLYLADLFPAFKQKFGNKPPWESCCVAHDRIYWKGETEHGYEKRRRADTQLKNCVIESAGSLSNDLKEQTAADRQQIENAYRVAAELMYRAVRVGGKPCTRLPWRWGYGWPYCPLYTNTPAAED